MQFCAKWKSTSTYIFNGLNCLHFLYKNVSILLCLSKHLMFVCMYVLLLFHFLVTFLNNVLEYSMCRLMFNRIIFDFSVYHHFLNLEDGNVGEESPVDIAALALFFTSFTFLFSHPVWDCGNFQKSDDYILPIFQRGVIQTISPVTTRVNGVLTSLSLPFPFLIHSYI